MRSLEASRLALRNMLWALAAHMRRRRAKVRAAVILQKYARRATARARLRLSRASSRVIQRAWKSSGRIGAARR